MAQFLAASACARQLGRQIWECRVANGESSITMDHWPFAISRFRQNAQQLQPSAPQNDLRSLAGTLVDHAWAWLWRWMPQALAQPQAAAAARCAVAWATDFWSPQAA